jgi:hypothetical protein
MQFYCLDPVNVRGSLLWRRDDALASVKRYIDTISIRISVTNWWGRAIPQAVSWPASHRGGPGSSPGQVWDLWKIKWQWSRFSPSTSVSLCQFSFHRLLHAHYYLSSSGAGTIGQLVADVPSALSLTPPQESKKLISGCVMEIHHI